MGTVPHAFMAGRQQTALLFGLVLCVIPAGSDADVPTATITMFSDAQCPCSAQFVSDVSHLLSGPAATTAGFGNGTIDFRQYFVPRCMDGVDACQPPLQHADLECIHGAGECVGHRYFLCAQRHSVLVDNTSPPQGAQPRRSSPLPPSYRQAPAWLAFQQCAYGRCQLCDVFTKLLCLVPCTTYLNFTDPQHNSIMRDCAAEVGLEWAALESCAKRGAAEGDALQHMSADVARAWNATYGTKGLPVVMLSFAAGGPQVHVRTRQAVPLFCGPTPLELLRALCADWPADALPAACNSTAQLCSLVQNATRLPECRRGSQ